MRTSRPRLATLLPAVVLAVLLAMIPASRALAAANVESWMEDDPPVMANPQYALERMRLIGVERVRLRVAWYTIAPRPYSLRMPRGFNASDPGARGYNWSAFDAVVIQAQQYGITLDFDLDGNAPLWAIGPHAPKNPQGNWEPSASKFGQFVHAVGVRYSGHYTPPGASAPLPRVSFWSIWNEPDYGPSLAPQGRLGDLSVPYAPFLYRNLLDAAWRALHATGHGGDHVIFGEVAPRGKPQWGLFSGMTPLVFLRSLYCVDSSFHPLRGLAARLQGCPTSAAGSRRFPAQHPALFHAAGFADHPYMRWYPPDHEVSPDPFTGLPSSQYASLGVINNLPRWLDRLNRVYGSNTRFPIYDTEFGYITRPPKHFQAKTPWVTQQVAAYYMNWAEYIHWRNPRIASYMQYLLWDAYPALSNNDWGGYSSGLINYGAAQIPKAGYYAYRLPLYLPQTVGRIGGALEVWGCVRPAHYALMDGDGPQLAYIQFAPGSSKAFTTIQTVTISDPNNCYFDLPIAFPGSGTVRIMWDYPTSDPMLGYFDPLQTHPVYSRDVQITLH